MSDLLKSLFGLGLSIAGSQAGFSAPSFPGLGGVRASGDHPDFRYRQVNVPGQRNLYRDDNLGVGIPRAVQTTLSQNQNYATPQAELSATRFNRNATDDVEDSLAQLYGGRDELNAMREQINSNIQDRLAGKVSGSTRQQLGRRALATGNTELGRGAVDDAYTGYLGLTSEQLQDSGQEQYKGLYSLYRSSVPIINGSQMMGQYAVNPGQTIGLSTLNPAQGIGFDFQNAGNDFEEQVSNFGATLSIADRQYEAAMNKAKADAARAQALFGGILGFGGDLIDAASGGGA